jgi:hypothetical protein
VLRLAVVVFVGVLGILALLTLMPGQEQVVPDSSIRLESVELNLYPQADREARWRFEAKSVDYQPQSRETVLHDLSDGQRLVGEELDFTLCADEVVIDSRDNLRSQQIFVHLVAENWDMDMRGDGGRPVLIDQESGRFDIPELNYTGEGLGENYARNVRMSFDLTEFEAEDPRNEFIDGDADYLRENLCPRP